MEHALVAGLPLWRNRREGDDSYFAGAGKHRPFACRAIAISGERVSTAV